MDVFAIIYMWIFRYVPSKFRWSRLKVLWILWRSGCLWTGVPSKTRPRHRIIWHRSYIFLQYNKSYIGFIWVPPDIFWLPLSLSWVGRRKGSSSASLWKIIHIQNFKDKHIIFNHNIHKHRWKLQSQFYCGIYCQIY